MEAHLPALGKYSANLATMGDMSMARIATVLLLATLVFGQDKPAEPKPLTPEQAADKVLAAFKAKDATALKTLAAKDDPDPWLVADELCFRGEHDAAAAFAKAAPRRDTEKLPTYVASRRGKPRNAEARKALAEANAARAAKNPQAALAAIEAVDAEAGGAVAVRLLYGRGVALRSLRRLEESAKAYLAAADAAERLGWLARTASALHESGLSDDERSEWKSALAAWERRLAIEDSRGNRAGVAATLGNIGVIHKRLGNYAKALVYQERALKLQEELGNRARVATALGSIGIIHRNLGAYAKALNYQERALKLSEELGDRAGVASSLVNIGSIHQSLGNYAKALECQERALKLKQDLGDRAGEARTLGNIGINHSGLGAHAMALDYYERSLKLFEELGNRPGVANTLANIGGTYESLGSHPKALDYYERALALANELGSLDMEVDFFSVLAAIHLALKEPLDAARAARRGVAKLPLLVSGLAEEQGATARDKWAGLMEVGVRAGMQLDDATAVSFFLESGRAGGLLESLGGRERLEAVIPEELRRDERAARAAVLLAQARHGRARKAGKRAEILAARTELDAAHDKVLAAVAKIQRSAKAVADVTYPKAAPLEKIRAALGPDETLVSYAILEDKTVALVVTNKEARVVALGKTSEIEAALKVVTEVTLGRWRGGDRGITVGGRRTPGGKDSAAARVLLRQQLIVALGLDPATKRLLISPAGALSYLPFAVLAPKHEVVYVPSGTTYTVLRDDRVKRGKGVLALGDPDYTTKRASSVYGSGLAPLPGTRVEAKAVGDVVLLDKRATEATFLAAVKDAKRWRSVHLACHGIVNGERPQLSSLALSPDGAEDGFLTVLEVFQAKIPADLVVLSACETAKGSLHQEGIIGFTRAFMLAGAPRVIVSLWKVDDDATRALMVKFYELWKPGKMATATALKKAQEFVRDHPEHPDWKKPFYWAAWQLWGLPD